MATLTVFMFFGLLLAHYSPKIVLKWYTQIEDPSAEKIRSILDELSKEAGINCPKTGIFRSSLPIAFTVGRGKKNIVMLSSKVPELLNDTEIRIMLSREIGHIVHRDVFANTAIAMVAGFLMFLSKAALWLALLTGFGQEEDPAPKIIGFLGMGLVAPIASLYVNVSLYPSQVTDADKYAAEHNEPAVTSHTLERIQKFMQLQPYEEVNPGHVHLYTLDPLRITNILEVHMSLFSFHPKIQDRIRSINNNHN